MEARALLWGIPPPLHPAAIAPSHPAFSKAKYPDHRAPNRPLASPASLAVQHSRCAQRSGLGWLDPLGFTEGKGGGKMMRVALTGFVLLRSCACGGLIFTVGVGVCVHTSTFCMCCWHQIFMIFILKLTLILLPYNWEQRQHACFPSVITGCTDDTKWNGVLISLSLKLL